MSVDKIDFYSNYLLEDTTAAIFLAHEVTRMLGPNYGMMPGSILSRGDIDLNTRTLDIVKKGVLGSRLWILGSRRVIRLCEDPQRDIIPFPKWKRVLGQRRGVSEITTIEQGSGAIGEGAVAIDQQRSVIPSCITSYIPSRGKRVPLEVYRFLQERGVKQKSMKDYRF